MGCVCIFRAASTISRSQAFAAAASTATMEATGLAVVIADSDVCPVTLDEPLDEDAPDQSDSH
jgi:hypothetical protein